MSGVPRTTGDAPRWLTWLGGRLDIARAGSGLRHLPAMEGLRGIAVFLVFLVHFMTLVAPWVHGQDLVFSAVRAVHAVGKVGVDLFFVLSGYLIYALLMARHQPLGRFWARRAWRIYPAFLAVLAIYLLLFALWPAHSKLPAGWGDALVVVALNLLLLPGLLPIEPLITVAWSLSYEGFFYLLLPLLVEGLRLRERSPMQRIAGWAVLTLLASLCFALAGGPVRLLMFVSGIALYEALALRGRWRPGSAAGLVAGAAALVLAVLPMDGPALQAVKCLVLGALFCVLCLAAFQPGRAGLAQALAWAPLRWLGNMSYSYYLIHGLALKAGFAVLGRLMAPQGDQLAVLLLGLPLFFAASLVPAFLLFHFVERPYSLDRAHAAPSPARLPAS